MKGFIGLLLALAGCLLLTIPAGAATYVDDMADLDNNQIKTYTGLAPYPITSQHLYSWSALPDLTMLTFASYGDLRGTATYRARNASTVTVGFYTRYGAFVNAVPGGGGLYACGPARENTSYLSGQHLVQASYSPSSQGIYTTINGSLMKAYYNSGGYLEFFSTMDRPGDLTGYGVNVYASSDGAGYSKLSLKSTKVVFVPGISYVYEEYTASVPSSATHIRVELVDTGVVHRRTVLPDGSYQDEIVGKGTAPQYASLASVTFTGDNLELGVPEPVVSENTSMESQYVAAEDSSEAKEREKASSSPESSVYPKIQTSKFEGTITSSQPSSRASGSKSASKKSSSAPEEEGAAREEPSAASSVQGDWEEPEDQAFLLWGGERASSPGAAAAIGLIILFLGMALFLLLRGRGG